MHERNVYMDVLNELKLYAESKEHSGAILLTGSWGCGKTYLINEFKNEINSNDKAILIVSLFGIDSIDSLTKAVKDRIIDELFKNKESDDNNEKRKKLSILIKLVSAFSDKLSNIQTNLSMSIYEFIEIKRTIDFRDGLDKKSKEIILIFDDFERSKIDIVELLGVINEYCENREIKVIIVADESKITINENDKKVINPKYLEFKEKVIQTTLNIQPNYYAAINNIANNYCETIVGYKEFLVKNINLLFQVFSESEYNNLRTVKSILIEFERVYKVCQAKFKNTYFINELLYSYSAMSFESRSGNFKRNEYGYLTTDSTLKKKYLNYNKNGSALYSLKELASENKWDETYFISEIQYKYFSEELTYAQKFLLSDFWGLDGEIIDKGLPECLNLAYDGELTLDEYVTLLNFTVTLTNFNYEIPFEIDYKKMIIGLDKKKYKILHNNLKEPKKRTFIENKRLNVLGEDAIALNNKIELFDNKIAMWQDRKKIIETLKTDGKLTTLYHKTIDCFDEELMSIVFESYKNGDNYTRREIGYWFNTLQLNNQYCSTGDDILKTNKNIELLIEKIKDLDISESDKFCKLIHNELLKMLSEKIEVIK